MTRSRSKSGYYGVCYHRDRNCPALKKPWKAYYRKHGQQICVGYFPTKEEAARAYNEAVKGKKRSVKSARCVQPYPLNSL